MFLVNGAGIHTIEYMTRLRDTRDIQEIYTDTHILLHIIKAILNSNHFYEVRRENPTAAVCFACPPRITTITHLGHGNDLTLLEG